MSTKEFHGAFVFRNQGHGILSSTYFNTPAPKPYPETAILVENGDSNDPFLGKFQTAWIEIGGMHFNGYITIVPNQTYAQGYDLEWTTDRANKKPIWRGIGNMEGDKLIGCYWGV